MNERQPKARDWVRVPVTPFIRATQPPETSMWQRGPITVLSSLQQTELPDGSGVGPQWHISISNSGRKRPSPKHVRRVLRAFGMVGAEEDNHHPGVARQFWMPVDPSHRVDCGCKTEEVTVTEPDGYRWQNPRDEAECRGCEYERLMGKPCPVHRRGAA